MKKIILLLFTFFMAMAMSTDLDAQIRQRQIKKNRKRMANYKGRKAGFGKDRRYSYFGVSVNAMNYFGDLAPTGAALSTDLSLTKPGFGVFYGHRLIMVQFMEMILKLPTQGIRKLFSAM